MKENLMHYQLKNKRHRPNKIKIIITIVFMAYIGCSAQRAIDVQEKQNLFHVINYLKKNIVTTSAFNDTLFVTLIDSSLSKKYYFFDNKIYSATNPNDCERNISTNRCLKIYLNKNVSNRIDFTLINWSTYDGYLKIDTINNNIVIKDISYIKSDQ